MRSLIKFTAALGLLALPCLASYDSMPTPPPSMPESREKPADDRARVKRGVHWYRHPDCATPVQQMELAYRLYDAGRYRKAANAYQALVYAWPDSQEAPRAQLALAQVQEHRELYSKAFDEYQYLFDYYPGQFKYEEVLDRQFKIANYLMTTPKGAFLFFKGFQAPERALPLFEKIIRNAPAWDRAALAQFNMGVIHEQNEEWEEAVAAFEVFQNRYRDPILLPQASFREAHCLYLIYKNHPNNENSCNAARGAIVEYIRSYPGDDRVTEARLFLQTLNNEQGQRAYEQARYYDRIARRPKSALIAYEEFLKKYSALNPDLTASAKARVEALQKESKNERK